MSDPVPVIAFPDDRCVGCDIKSDINDTRYSSRPTGALDPIEDAIAIGNEEPRGCSAEMPSAQIAFVADDKLDMLIDEIDAVRQLNQFRFPTR